jgi:predicted nuclease of predicted toxin-antitoxin system
VSVSLYVDHHVPSAVTGGLRRRGVAVLTAYEDGMAEADDEVLLQRATALGRCVFTQDEDFLVIASQWQRAGRPFAGVIFGSQENLSIGQAIENLELIAKACEPEQMHNGVQFIPLR